MALASEMAKQALAHHRRGEFAQAIALYRQILKKQPKHVGVLSNLAMALLKQGEPIEAARIAQSALVIDADHSAARSTLCAALRAAGKHDESLDVWCEAISRHPQTIEPRVELAKALTLLRRIEQAIDAWRDVYELDANHVESRVEAARLLLRLARREEAEVLTREALRLVPEDGEANVLMARMERRAGDVASARRRLERVMEGVTGDAGSSQALAVGRASLELATLLESAGGYEDAFAAAERGQAALRSRLSDAALDTAPALSVIELCRRQITAESVARWKPPVPDGRRDPAFIVGFPRAGTTLIEQMLAAHPNVIVTDELPLAQAVKDATVARLRMRQQYPQSLDALGERQVTILRDVYFDEARRWLGERAMSRRLVDKAPLNTVDLGLVRRLFPEARVIVALRDPRDTVLSCFFQAFVQGLPHLFNFESTAALYAAMMNLWLHYRQVLGLKWMQVRYEDVVADTEAHARSMIEFIGEPWDPSMLQFHDPAHRRYVTTPSFEDVAQPVYATSMKRWEHYRAQFERVRPLLEPLMREFGYGDW